MKKVVIAATALCWIPLWGQQTPAPDLAAQNAALEQRVRDLEERLIALEGKVRMMQSSQQRRLNPRPKLRRQHLPLSRQCRLSHKRQRFRLRPRRFQDSPRS